MHGKETSDTSDVQHDPRLDAIQKALLGAISAAPTFDQEIRDDSLVSPFPISSGFVPASQGKHKNGQSIPKQKVSRSKSRVHAPN